MARKQKIVIETTSPGGYEDTSMHLLYCNKHDSTVWHWSHDDCPACVAGYEVSDKLRELRRSLKEKTTENKLLKYQLKEEQSKHMMTKADAAEYLVLKQKVVEEVDERVT